MSFGKGNIIHLINSAYLVPDTSHWFVLRFNRQVDLLVETLITGIQTQGDPLSDSWMTKFVISHSYDCEHFERLQDSGGQANVSVCVLPVGINRNVFGCY